MADSRLEQHLGEEPVRREHAEAASVDVAALRSNASQRTVVGAMHAWVGGAFDQDELVEALHRLRATDAWITEWDGSRRAHGALKNLTSQLIGRFAGAATAATRRARPAQERRRARVREADRLVQVQRPVDDLGRRHQVHAGHAGGHGRYLLRVAEHGQREHLTRPRHPHADDVVVADRVDASQPGEELRDQVVVGTREMCRWSGLRAEQVNLLVDPDKLPERVMVQTRYRQQPVAASAVLKDGGLELQFDEPMFAVTLGQSAVVYSGDRLLGGGVISERLE